jgi:predicted MFS family arabinose efflux permease
MAGCGGAAGLIRGGTLTQWFGWRAVLLINVPVGVAILLASLALVPADDQPSTRRRFDVAGALTVTAGLTVLVYGVLEGSDAGWGSAKTLLTGVVAGVLLVAFVAVEAAAKVPLVPLSFLRHPAVRSANPVAALLSAAMFPMWFLLALYDQRVLGFSPVRTGMAILPLVGALIVVNILAPRLVARYGARNLTTTGLLVAAAGLAWMSRATLESGYRQGLLVPSLVTGIGFGLSFVPLMTAATTAISVEQSGLASGLVNVSQQMGGALGLAVLMTLASSETHNRADLTGPSALAHGLTTGLLGASVAALAGAAVARLLLRPVRSTTAGTADTPRTSPGLHSVPAGSRETSPAS